MKELEKIIQEESVQHEGDGKRHSHHHSHHSHHSSKKKKKYRSKLKKIKEYIKKNKKVVRIQIVCVAFFLLCLGAVFAWGLSQRQLSSEAGEVEGDLSKSEDQVSTLIVELPFFEGDVPLVGTHIMDYMDLDISTPARKVYQEHKDGQRLDVGLEAVLSFGVRGLPKGVSRERAEVLIGEDASLTDATCHVLRNNANTLRLKYLKTNTQYYYRVNFTFSNGASTSAQGTFRTADTPRIISIDGIYNVRDIGNWETTGGKRIKQGLLYRGTELDGAVEAKYTLTAKGMKDMLSVLEIRTDMDLRASTDNKYGTDALGIGVKHTYYNAPMYTAIFADASKSAVRNVFKDLANPDNYPIYMHCTYGLDRTGTICYLLEGLLGVSEEDLMRDYQLSAFHHGGVSDEGIEGLVTQLQSLEGVTMQEKIEGYLLSIGVTKEEIQSIRNIFLSE